MSNYLTSAALMAKVGLACASARAMLALGDRACNQAYYAMFDAARAALVASGAPTQQHVGMARSELIATFSEHLAENGLVSRQVGPLLNGADVSKEWRLVLGRAEFDSPRQIVSHLDEFLSIKAGSCWTTGKAHRVKRLKSNRKAWLSKWRDYSLRCLPSK